MNQRVMANDGVASHMKQEADASATVMRRADRLRLELRRDVLDRAMVAFAERGYAKTTMQQIAADVGVAVGSLYAVFPSKESIYTELVEKFAESFAEIAEDALTGVGSAVDKILCYVRRTGECFSENESLAKLYLGEIRTEQSVLGAQTQTILDGYRVQIHDRLVEVVRIGIEQDLIEATDPDEVAVAVQSVINGCLVLWLLSPERHGYHTRAAMVTEMMFRGLLSELGREQFAKA